ALWDRWPIPAGTNKTVVQLHNTPLGSAEETISAGGALFTHRTEPNGSETLASTGATRWPVTLAAFLMEKGSPNIRYEYWIPKEDNGQRDVKNYVTETDVALQDSNATWADLPSSSFYRRAHMSAPWQSDNRIPLAPYHSGWNVEAPTSRPVNDVVGVPDPNGVVDYKLSCESRFAETPRLHFPPGRCPICHRARNQRRHFCKSDIVVHALVLSLEHLDGSLRYDVGISESYRNLVDLQQREFFWVPDAGCPCPRLRVGRDYVITAQAHNDLLNKESKLVVDNTSFVRRFTERRRKQLEKLRETQAKRCNLTT
ncbi:unnamed protein product, partial [Ixodes hexagonus]